MNYSLELKTAILKKLVGQADINCSQLLDDCHQKFLEGDRSALMSALMTCAFFNRLIPDWTAYGLLVLDKQLASGEINDLNEFFNLNIPTPSKRRIEQNKKNNEIKALNKLISHRKSGGKFNDEEGFRELASNIGIPYRALKEIQKNNKVMENYKKNNGDSNEFHIIGETGLSLVSIAKSYREK